MSLPSYNNRENMTLRPNPTTMMHTRIAARYVEHRDAFLFSTHDGGYAMAVEHRAGGRGSPFDREGFRFHPRETIRQRPLMADYDQLLRSHILHEIRFSPRSPRPDEAWLREYYHKWLRMYLTRPPREGYRHVNILCHWFYVYDLDPTKGFHNHWAGKGGKY